MKIIIQFLLIILIGNSACDKKSELPQPMTDSTPPMTEKKKYSILGLGDSYTYGQNVDTSERYLSQLYTKLTNQKYNIQYPKIIARTGWRTDDLLSNIKIDGDKNKYDFVFLLIGVNNEYQGLSPESYRSEFVSCLDKALAFASGISDHVFVVSIPDYSVTRSQDRQSVPNAISLRLDEYNKINREEADKKKVNYIYITDDSRQAYNDATLIASDGLHPSEKMYSQWVDKILPIITKKMQ